MAHSTRPRHEKAILAQLLPAAIPSELLTRDDIDTIISAPRLDLTESSREEMKSRLQGAAQAYVMAWIEQTVDQDELKKELESLERALKRAESLVGTLGLDSEDLTRGKDMMLSGYQSIHGAQRSLNDDIKSIPSLREVTTFLLEKSKEPRTRSATSNLLGMRHKGGDDARNVLVLAAMRTYEWMFDRKPAVSESSDDGGPFPRFFFALSNVLHDRIIETYPDLKSEPLSHSLRPSKNALRALVRSARTSAANQ